MRERHLPDLSLTLFDGGAAGDGGAAEAGQQGETTAQPGSTRPGNTGEAQKVVYGKRETPPADGQTQPSDAGRAPEAPVPEDRRRAFRELVEGEYKDLFTQETQRIIDRRFRETKELEQRMGQAQPVLDMLMQRYGVADLEKLTAAVESDDAYWGEAAAEAGMNVEQYKQLQKLQRENAALQEAQRQRQSREAAQAQLRKWYGEAEQMSALYPAFDLNAETQNPQFLAMLKAGVPVRHAYEVIHMDDIKAGVAQQTAQRTEKQVVDGIRAKGARPAENGTAAQSAFTVKDDVSQLSRKDRAEIARRVARGERIQF